MSTEKERLGDRLRNWFGEEFGRKIEYLRYRYYDAISIS